MRFKDSTYSSLSDWPKSDKEKYALMYAEHGSIRLDTPRRRARRLWAAVCLALVVVGACFFAYYMLLDGGWL